jgi:hypothetical protein
MPRKTLAIDFDGTIVHNAYPDIGKPIIFAFETLKKLQEEGFLLILWTYRSGTKLEEAVKFCKNNGIEFYAVNKSYPEELMNDSISRKINADLFIDDRNIGGLMGWGEIHNLLLGFKNRQVASHKKKKVKPKKGFFSKLEDLFNEDN